MTKFIPLILSGVFLNALAQILLKKGMITIGHFVISWKNFWPVASVALINPFILAGVMCYVISLMIWMLALSRVEVSFAYPFLSIGYVIVAIVGYYAFSEDVSAYRVVGIALICLGVFLISINGSLNT